MAKFLFVVEGIYGTRKIINSIDDMRRLAYCCEYDIIDKKPAEKVGIAEFDEMYDIPIFENVYKVEDEFYFENGEEVKTEILPMNLADEEEIII